MAYQRKTKDVYILCGNYGCGWEEMIEYDTWKEAWEDYVAYQNNEPHFPHCLRKRRVPLQNNL